MISRLLFILLIIFTSSSAISQEASIKPQPVNTCNEGNANNIGIQIKNWLLCGADFNNQVPTILGSTVGMLSVIAIAMTVIITILILKKYAYLTAAYGVAGGKQQLPAGFLIFKFSCIIILAMPFISNGFSLGHYGLERTVTASIRIADYGSVRASEFLNNNGGFFKVDLQNVEELTKALVYNESCSAAANIYSGIGLEGALDGTGSAVSVRKAYKSDKIVYSWDFDYVHDGLIWSSNETTAALCGSFVLSYPSQLAGSLTVNNGTLSLKDNEQYKQPYLDILQGQIDSLERHIANIRKGLWPLYYDLDTYSEVTKLKGELSTDPLNSELRSRILATYNLADQLSVQNTNSFQLIARIIGDQNEAYRSDISRVGINAASAVNSVEGIISYKCPETKSPYITTCVEGKTWSEELQDSGFVAYPAYYWVIQKQNQKVIDLQSHFVEQQKSLGSYYTENGGKPVEMRSLESSEAIMSRTSTIIGLLDQYMIDKSFSINMNVLEGQGNDRPEAHNGSYVFSVLDTFRRYINNIATGFIKAFTSIIVDDTGQSDLIVKIVKLGILLSAISSTLIGFWLLIKVGSAIVPIARFGSAVLKKFSGKGSTLPEGDADTGDNSFLSTLAKSVFYAFLFCTIAGFFCQYIVPALPLIKWGAEILRWATSIIVFIVIIPFFLMSHAAITDERIMAEQTMAGYGTGFEIFLRPILLTTSFTCVFLLTYIADLMVTLTSSFMISMVTESVANPFHIFFIVITLCIIAINLILRTFDLISYMSDAVIERLSFGAKSLSPDNDGGSSRIMAIAAMAGATGAKMVIAKAVSALAPTEKSPSQNDQKKFA